MSSRCSMPPALRLALLAGLAGAAAASPVFEFNGPAGNARTKGTVKEIAGPDHEIYLTVEPKSRAAKFTGDGSCLAFPGDDSALRFSNGDAITIEAWVRLDKIADGQNHYVVGKGRTHRKGFPRDNQNWALRLRGVGKAAQVSFLFRSRGPDGAYHRWNSELAISAGSRWHHIAVRYEFGKPSSVRAVVDGRVCKGSWDLGGASSREPVTDDDEVWIGTALGGAKANSFHGAIAHVAVHRALIPTETLTARYEVQREIPPPNIADLPAGRVQVELFRSKDPYTDWPFLLDPPVRTVDAGAFALFRMPTTYDADGQRLEQKNVYLLRLAAPVTLEKGHHELLLRAPGLARLRIGGEEIATLGKAFRGRDAHGSPRPAEAFPYPRARLGTHEVIVPYESDGTGTLVIVDALAGVAGGKPQVGELLVAARRGDSDWSLLTPADEFPFEAGAMERYKQAERDHHAALDTELRRSLAKTKAGMWNIRHEAARKYMQSLPPFEVPELPEDTGSANPIDHFLAARITKARAASGDAEGDFTGVHAILEENCFRCHGKKAKGGLKLDTRAAALEGGDSGPAVVPGDAAASAMLTRILATDKDERMPPKGDGLTKEEAELVRHWVNNGAPWQDTPATITIPDDLDELAFLRRLYLDTVGVFPTPEDIAAYQSDSSFRKTADLIDRLLADPRHAGHWVSYWQDVLAENPLLVKPTRNNTGPFRWWLHEALLDNVPFDRFVTELITFSGGTYGGAAAGFKVATDNDAPMAAKAHTLGAAFLGLEMKCARCHDAPFHSHTQEELFSVAAMLNRSPLEVPASSTVPSTFFAKAGDRKPLIAVTLDPETPVAPRWPFADLAPPPPAEAPFANPAEELAYQVTRPENRRFAQVIVNRLWKRYFGEGLVEPAGDWEGNDPSHPELLEWLAREFTANGYDLRHVSRLILTSSAYRRAPRSVPAATVATRFFEAPLRRRLTAEQLVDALFAATGTPVYSEELTLDVEGWHPHSKFLNMGRPRRAWEFISLSTERDRPSLTLPNAASIVSFMDAYGWRPDRSDPRTGRPSEANLLQAGVLANGLLTTWWSRLSDFSDLTPLALEAESADTFIDALYLRLLTRTPTSKERRKARAILGDEFNARLARPADRFTKDTYVPEVREVSWSNHLHPRATTIAQESEKHALAGPKPTDFLSPGWRQAAEDLIWALINSPEMQFVP